MSRIFQGYDYKYYNHLKDVQDYAKIIRPPSVNETHDNSSLADNSTTPLVPTSTSPTIIHNETISNSTFLEDIQHNYTFHKKDRLKIPEVRTDFLGFMDTIFVWFRYIHFTIVPILIFAVHKVNIVLAECI